MKTIDFQSPSVSFGHLAAIITGLQTQAIMASYDSYEISKDAITFTKCRPIHAVGFVEQYFIVAGRSCGALGGAV